MCFAIMRSFYTQVQLTFGEFEEATVITDKVLDSSYRHCVNIVELSD